jgi:uncharacterized protein (DUF1697 family)
VTRWVLLLRAVNLGPHNKLAMADLRRVLEGLGHSEVTTYLNSGNATFESPQRSPKKLADEVHDALLAELGLDVGVCVRRGADLQKALDELPAQGGYQSISVLFDKPSAAALEEFLATDWSPERVQGNDQVVYIGFENAARTKLTNAKLEKLLGVGATARTPATLRKLL